MCCHLLLIGQEGEKFLRTHLEVKQLWFIVTYGSSLISREKPCSLVPRWEMAFFWWKEKKNKKAVCQNLLFKKKKKSKKSPPIPSLQTNKKRTTHNIQILELSGRTGEYARYLNKWQRPQKNLLASVFMWLGFSQWKDFILSDLCQTLGYLKQTNDSQMNNNKNQNNQTLLNMRIWGFGHVAYLWTWVLPYLGSFQALLVVMQF